MEIAHFTQNSKRRHAQSLPDVDPRPRTLASRRIAARFRLYPATADLVAALAGFTTEAR